MKSDRTPQMVVMKLSPQSRSHSAAVAPVTSGSVRKTQTAGAVLDGSVDGG